MLDRLKASLRGRMERLVIRRLASGLGPRISINLRPRLEPWGGGNQFNLMLARYLRAQGHAVGFDLSEDTRCILMLDPRRGSGASFDIDAIARFKERHPDVPVIHRINECDKRKGTSGVDEGLRLGNQLADYTVFVSEWLRDYFIERWFDPQRPHQAIYNGADPTIFRPPSRHRSSPVLRLVTHHWSDNWMKGFRVYAEIDRLIAEGLLPDVALTVIGRWPAEIRWRAARLLPPMRGRRLARELGAHDAYITATQWEPAGMHYIEGVQCGLPLLYHVDGGGAVEYGRRHGLAFEADVVAVLREAAARLPELRLRLRDQPPATGRAVCERYGAVIRQLLDGR